MVKTDTSSKAVLLGNLNVLEEAAEDVWNDYPHRLTKKNIYTATGPQVGEW